VKKKEEYGGRVRKDERKATFMTGRKRMSECMTDRTEQYEHLMPGRFIPA